MSKTIVCLSKFSFSEEGGFHLHIYIQDGKKGKKETSVINQSTSMDESSLSIIVDNLRHLREIIRERGRLDLLRLWWWQMDPIISKLQELSDLFNKQYGNKTLVEDAAAANSAAVEAQVIVSNFLHDVIRQQERRFYHKQIFFHNHSLTLKNAILKLKLIELAINRVIGDTCSSADTTTTTTGGESHHHDDDILLFVGRKEEIHLIQEKLISAETDMFHIISIVGMAGIGKTCLARKIYNSHQVRSHFECVAWICAPRYSSKEELLKALVEQVMCGGGGGRIFDFLAEKRYLIVIDGILTNETWSDLHGAFPRGSSNGSRILLTTCNTTTALAAQKDCIDSSGRDPSQEILNPYRLGKLNDAESWELFSKKVNLPFNLLSSCKKEIVKKCDGLPLAIVHLANLLAKENENINTTDQLVLDSVDTDDCLGRPWTSHIVDMIVSHLPSHLKLCLFYFGYFPKYTKIPTRRLIALWIAEGLVTRPNRAPESVAEGYLEQLIRWNMIEVVKYSSNQRPKKCCLAYFLREHLLITTVLSKQRNQASSSSSSSSSRGTKRGVLRVADHAPNDEVMASPEHNKSVLSFLSFDYREGPAPGERVRNFLQGANKGCFRLLRVLDLERVYKPVLPKEIGRLIHLRYLGLRWTYLDTLPSSIVHLENLQTLDIKHTYINTLPEPLSDLVGLRHLYLNGTRLAQSQCMPSDLLTLWGIVLGEGQILNTLWWQSELTQLELVCHLPSDPDQEKMANCILRLGRLQKLRLTSIDQLSKPFSLRLKHFTDHKNLSDIYLFGRLEKLLMANEFPPNLTELTLSASNLKKDPMPTLGMLSKLTILKLYADTYIGKLMVCSSSGFLQLQVLKIWKLKQLEEWIVEEGSMPVLRTLEIRACNSLLKLPVRLQGITTLVELKISDMPKEFTAMVKRNKDEEWYKKGNICFIDWEARNSSIEAASSSLSSSTIAASSSSFGSILLLFFLLVRRSVPPTKPSTRVQGLPALGV